MQDILRLGEWGLGYVYMDLPYGNKKERMESAQRIVSPIRTRASELKCLSKADKVSLAIKSLQFMKTLMSHSQCYGGGKIIMWGWNWFAGGPEISRGPPA